MVISAEAILEDTDDCRAGKVLGRWKYSRDTRHTVNKTAKADSLEEEDISLRQRPATWCRFVFTPTLNRVGRSLILKQIDSKRKLGN